jgi:hypothetical protein
MHWFYLLALLVGGLLSTSVTGATACGDPSEQQKLYRSSDMSAIAGEVTIDVPFQGKSPLLIS